MKRILLVLFVIVMTVSLSGCIEAVIYSFEAEDDLSVVFTNDNEFYCYGDRAAFSDGASHVPYKLTDPAMALDVALTDTTAVFLTADGLYGAGVIADLPFGDASTLTTAPVKFYYDEYTASFDANGRYVAADLSDAKQVISGDNFTLVLKNDGTVYGWGSNKYNQLLTEGTEFTNVPVRLGTLDGISQIACCSSGRLCAAIDMDGHVWVWGQDMYYNNFVPPVRIPEAEKAVEVVCTGGTDEGAASEVYFLDADAKVFGFSPHTSGLPYGFGEMTDLPEIFSLVAGDCFCAAKDGEGNVWTWGGWGCDQRGQLGRGIDYDTEEELYSDAAQEARKPAKVEGLTGVISLSAGRNHVMAMTQNMSIYLWGDNSKGQLGLDPEEVPYSTTPVKAPKINAKVN